MSRQHLVRVGVLGHIGRFTSVDAVKYPRGSRVICRTVRGLEVGQILTPVTDGRQIGSDGSVLRRVTTADELLLARLAKNKDAALRACSDLLAERGYPVALMDVEHLFDGQSLYFYFLGDVSPELQAVTQELAETYETKVQFRKFIETVTDGCGPGCGTDEAEGGCGLNGCSSCSVAAACKSKR